MVEFQCQRREILEISLSPTQLLDFVMDCLAVANWSSLQRGRIVVVFVTLQLRATQWKHSKNKYWIQKPLHLPKPLTHLTERHRVSKPQNYIILNITALFYFFICVFVARL